MTDLVSVAPYRCRDRNASCTWLFVANAAFALAVLLSPPPPASANSDQKAQDIVDNVRDGAAVGRARGNWVAVPIPMSNPTIGTGLEAILMYLHPKRRGEETATNATSGLVGLYTNTDSWFVGGFHNNSWSNDRFRFTGAVGEGDLNLSYYGTGGVSVSDNGLDYELKIAALFSQIQARLPWMTDWYGGVRYVYMRSKTIFSSGNAIPGIPVGDVDVPLRAAGLGLLLTYDSRDDNYYPTRGQYFQTSWTNFDPTWGGDLNFDKSVDFYNYYHSFNERTVLALRARIEASGDGTPFFFLSTLDMRGFPRDLYMDNYTLSTNAETRYKFSARWGGVAFVEAGTYADTFSGLTYGSSITSYGAGLRWQATADKPLNLALDVAVSTDDSAIYLRVGEQY